MTSRTLTVKDIARIAKVSKGTVDRALHGRGEINQQTRSRILKIASEHKYRPHPAARMLVMRRSPLSIGVCIPREIRLFYDQVRDGILEEARRFESLGINVIYRPFQALGRGEHERIKEMLRRDIKALIMTPGTDPKLAALVDDAEKRNIRVVCVAGDIAGTLRSTVVSSDAELNGTCAAELMAKFIRRKARVVIFTGMLQSEIQSKEVRSFSDAFAQFSSGGRVIEVIEDHEDEEEAFQKCSSLLARVRNIDGMYISTANCLPVCAALEAAGFVDRVKLVTTDLFPAMTPWFQRGTILASIYQRPYGQGQTAVRLVVDHLVSGRPFPRTSYLNPLVALRSNLKMFRELANRKRAQKADGQ